MTSTLPLPLARRPDLVPRRSCSVSARRLAALALALLATSADFPRGPIERGARVLTSRPGDGSAWARGSTYKACFGAHGARFVPFFGSRAARNHPITFRVTDALVGDDAISFRAAADPVLADRRVTFDRGAFVESYELEGTSIEQTFLFPGLPRAGELLVRVAVDTGLVARDGALGIEFGNELGFVRYGDALVVDAGGRRFAADTRLVDGAIEIRVAADALAAARFPILVDPVVSTFALDATPADRLSADVSYSALRDRYLAVAEEVFSATDHDVVAWSVSSAGTVLATAYVDMTTDHWVGPKDANNLAGDDWLVVASVGQPGTRVIRGATVDGPTFAVGAQVTISGAETGDKTSPDVGGDPFFFPPSYFCVAWERVVDGTDTDVHARLVGTDGNPAGATILIESTPGTLDGRPSIAKGNDTERWTIVWQREIAPGDHDVFARQVRWDGIFVNATYPVAAGAADHTDPTVTSPLANGLGIYLVACVEDAGAHHDVRATVMLGTSVVSSANVSALNGGDVLEDQVQPSADTDGRHFTIAYAETRLQNPGDHDVYVDDVAMADASIVVVEGHRALATSGTNEARPELAARASSAGFAPRSMIVWDDEGAPSDTDVDGAFYDSPTGGPLVPYCFGDGTGTACPCGNVGSAGRGCPNSTNGGGAQLFATGFASTTVDTLVLHGTGTGNTSPGLYFQGTTSLGGGTLFGDGLRCAGGSVIRLASKIAVGGNSQFPAGGDPLVSVRGAIPVTGGTRTYQLWFRDAQSFCTTSTFNLSNGLRVSWTP